jgi:NAD/NADP transhydrogenase alpha subunit
MVIATPRGDQTMIRSMRRTAIITAVLAGTLMLQGCVVGAVVGTAGAVVGGTAKAAGAVVGAGVDAVTTSDAETRARAERQQREFEREQRRCEQRQRQGKRC